MKEIPLTKGKVALVDDEDYQAVSGHRWQAVNWSKPGGRDRWYASRSIRTARGTSKESLHHFLSGPGKVDHWNGNGLDNCRRNLRRASNSQNLGNQMGRRAGQFKGVTLEKGCRQRWRAYIVKRGGNGSVSLGTYPTPEDAARAYDAAARERWGEFCCVNFPNPGERSALTGEIVPLSA